MPTKKTAPKATKAEQTDKVAKPIKTVKAVPAKPEPKAVAKSAAKPAAKPQPKAPAKAAPKAVVKIAPKPTPKAPVKIAPAKPAPAPKATAKPAAKAPKAAPAVATPLLPEVVEAPAPTTTPAPAPKPKKAAAPSQDSLGLSPHATTVLEAIRTGRAIELIFSDENANPPRTFEPRRLVFDVFTQAWFAWGWDRRYNAERHHRLDMLAEANLVDGPGRAAQGPYKDGTPANQIGGWLGGEPIPVKAVLMKQWIFAVKQAPAPFPEFRIEDAPDGKATVSFTATDLRAIARWCMQFGDGIQVLEPQRLVDRIKQVGIAWGGKPVPAAPPAASKPVAAPAPRPEREHREHRESRREHRDEPRREHRDEPRREHRDEPRRDREAPKKETESKPAKVEVRVERL